MMAKAIGPQSTLRASGIIASTAAAAVSTMGRKRRTVASRIACHSGWPAAMSCSIWSTRITELRMIMPASAMTPSSATKPKGWRNTSSANATPMTPSGAVSTTMKVREKLFSCSISMPIITTTSSGMPAAIELSALRFSSKAPPISMR